LIFLEQTLISQKASTATFGIYLSYISDSKTFFKHIVMPKLPFLSLLFFCVLVCSNVLFAQQTDSLYLDESGKLTASMNSAILRIIKQDGKGNIYVNDYYANGTLKFECTYLSSAKKMHPSTAFLTIQTYEKKDGLALNGKYALYYESGKLRELGNYEKGKSTGIYQRFLENGQLYYQVTEEMPQYKGGDEQLLSDLKGAMKAVKAKYDVTKTGRVIVTFIVDPTGKCVNHQIVRSEHDELNAPALEAIRLINQDWLPGKMKGEPVNVEYNIPMVF
jgi:TonB family protein